MSQFFLDAYVSRHMFTVQIHEYLEKVKKSFWDGGSMIFQNIKRDNNIHGHTLTYTYTLNN
jgi:hypothetical protein